MRGPHVHATLEAPNGADAEEGKGGGRGAAEGEGAGGGGKKIKRVGAAFIAVPHSPGN